ncbi:MAG: alpha-(1-_3)-arabinofuranosyltransferase family protein [Actinomycetota bacterium]
MRFWYRLSKPRIHQLVLIFGAFIACVTSYPGQVPADTKLYLYTNPLRLISDSIWSWDGRNFGGWVPHQNVGYLWPSGPFFAINDLVSIPDWFAHRLWITALFCIAGVGSYRLGRHIGLSCSAAFLVGISYQFSPYVLPYISRTSALLIPWSLLPWLIMVSLRYAKDLRMRDLALFSFFIASSGGLNATALIMIAPAPLIWMIHLHRGGVIPLRHLLAASWRLAVVSVLVSTWWLAGLFVQGRYGADVLAYSEALVSTSATSSAPEVLRGLGYWLFYDRGPVAPLTTSSWPYQASPVLIAVGGTLIVMALIGLRRIEHWRKPIATMLLVGAVLAIGAYPFTGSNLLFRLLADNPTSTLSLALRSSTRAVPLVVLALALGIGGLWNSRRKNIGTTRTWIVYSSLLLLILGNFPSALNGDIVDRALTRPEDLPQAWIDAAEFLDERFDSGYTGSVLLLPGVESAAYRWGYPVDPILPGITRKPLLTRDWLPLGSPPLMDLLYALDDSFQNGTADPGSIAPIAKLLGADTVMFVSSHQYERFGTVDPSRAFDIFDPVPPGLSLLAEFGEVSRNVAPVRLGSPPKWSESTAAFPPVELPEITLFAVNESPTQARFFRGFDLVAADGTGLVDLAAGSLVTGNELLISEASLDDESLSSSIRGSSRFIISDSKRKRAHHWRGSQDVWGATEPASGFLSVRDDFDSRLPVYPGAVEDSFSFIEQSSVEATATAYGAELKYHPEFRPRMSVDGDPETAWRIGADRSAVGHILTLKSDEPLSSLQIVQPESHGADTWIEQISIRIDSGEWTRYTLDDTSHSSPGQHIDLKVAGRTVALRIDRTSRVVLGSSLGVGFAELLDSSLVGSEVVRLPDRLQPTDNVPLVYSMTRLRSDAFDRTRLDPETSMIRRLPVPMSVSQLEAEVRLSHRAADETVARALGIDSGFATERLHGGVRWWGPAAFDNDSLTTWRPAVSRLDNDQFGTLYRTLDEPLQWIEIEQSHDAPSSRISRVLLTLFKNGRSVESMTLDIPDAGSKIVHRFELPVIEADAISMTVVGIDSEDVVDEISGRIMSAPFALSELRSNSWRNESLPAQFDSGCRTDLASVDGNPIPIRIQGSVAAALRGEPVHVTVCGALPRIERDSLFRTALGSQTGWDIDRVRFMSAATERPSPNPEILDVDGARSEFRTVIPDCGSKCWVEMPFGFSEGWQGSLEGDSLGPPMRSAAGRSLWPLEKASGGDFAASWTPQRWMWIGLAVSLMTLVSLTALSLRERRHLRRTLAVDDSWPLGGQQSTRLAAAVIGFALGAILVTPVWGIPIALAILLCPRVLLGRLAITSVGIGYTFVVLQQIRTGVQPGFGWPAVFERAHRPMLASLIVYVLSLHMMRPEPPVSHE